MQCEYVCTRFTRPSQVTPSYQAVVKAEPKTVPKKKKCEPKKKKCEPKKKKCEPKQKKNAAATKKKPESQCPDGMGCSCKDCKSVLPRIYDRCRIYARV